MTNKHHYWSVNGLQEPVLPLAQVRMMAEPPGLLGLRHKWSYAFISAALHAGVTLVVISGLPEEQNLHCYVS